MHVKLEVETQPLSHFVVKMRQALKILLVLGAFIICDLALGVWIYTWGSTHHKNPETAQLYAFGIPVAIAILFVSGLFIAKWNAEQEARWRSE